MRRVRPTRSPLCWEEREPSRPGPRSAMAVRLPGVLRVRGASAGDYLGRREPRRARKEASMNRFGSLFLAAVLASFFVTAPSRAQEKLEIFSWWAGDEGPALKALIDLYSKKYPGIQVINSTVTGGSGVNAKAVLKTRMLGGDPPDSFQVHMGHELTDTWVVTEKMEPLDAIYTEMGFDKAFPKGVLDIVSYQGHPYSVPVNIHRANVLW